MRKFPSHLVLACVAGILPIGIFGHSYGPPPRVTGGPGDSVRACTQCHSGSALNSGSGSVNIVLQSGPVYIPGVKQRIAVQVADPDQQRWGFELSARLDSDPESSSAGDFTPVDNFTQVICEDNAPRPCASGPTFITHTSAGTRRGTPAGATFVFDWTPPSSDVGPVTLFVAGNAANADAAQTGDHIYTSSIQLTPAIPAPPSVTSVVSTATSAADPVSPNTWVTISGLDLGVTTRSWADGDLLNGAIPFSLDGVSVVMTQFNAPRLAYVGSVSPTEVKFLLPSDLVVTTTTVQVRNPAGMSAPVRMTIQANAPQLFTLDGKSVLGTHADGTYLGKAGTLPLTGRSPIVTLPEDGFFTTPATPGESITVYATGLGVTSPALIPGQLPLEASNLATLPQVTIGTATATVVSAAVVPGTAGLYQISVQVPSDAPSGDLPVVVQVGTAKSTSTLLTVQK